LAVDQALADALPGIADKLVAAFRERTKES